jgi:hypothetical protein
MRAIKSWQEAHSEIPRVSLIWPDHVDLVLWLEAQLEQERANTTTLGAKLAVVMEAWCGQMRRLENGLPCWCSTDGSYHNGPCRESRAVYSDLSQAAADRDAKVGRAAVSDSWASLLNAAKDQPVTECHICGAPLSYEWWLKGLLSTESDSTEAER